MKSPLFFEALEDDFGVKRKCWQSAGGDRRVISRFFFSNRKIL